MMAEKLAIDERRIFIASCFALIATSVNFAIMGDIMGPLREVFLLTNEQVGMIGGAGLWGFALSIFIFGPLVDAMGMRLQMRLALSFHIGGVLLMLAAGGFWTLLLGQCIIAMGNGLVEAYANPLIATIYPDRKTEKLNQFHVWFPGGIVIGGVLMFLLNQIGAHSWQLKLCFILIPAVIYGILYLGQKFPATERVQSGVSFGGMFKATFGRPFFWLMLFCMMITASIELGPNRWIPAVFEAGNVPGILVLTWISIIMAVMRQFAGPLVHRLSSLGMLLFSAVVGGIGLFWLSYATSNWMAFVSATLFAVGVCYFWPTMLGVMSERVPRGGALALAMLGGAGALFTGLVTSAVMGHIGDKYGHRQLEGPGTVQTLEQALDVLPAQASGVAPLQARQIQLATDHVRETLSLMQGNRLPEIKTANALRAIISTGLEHPVIAEAKRIMSNADNYGGRVSFRFVAPFSLVIILVFGSLLLLERRKERPGPKVHARG